MRGKSLLVLIGLIALTLGGGFACGQVVAPNIPAWYAGLARPAFNPPNWVFAPVWSLLYVLMAIAAWRIWRRRGGTSPAMAIWLGQLALNFGWSLLFFGAHRPALALIDLALLWLAIAAMILAFRRLDRWAAWLMVPYLAWVSFAGALNWEIWRLNG